jgi:ABC-type Fe3+/spermidine/putrescine transport system ATPase subunit
MNDSSPKSKPAPRGAIDVVGVSKRFGGVAALSDINLHIDAGSFFSLLGPSGCGKTTLLRILAGLEAPDEGKVLLDGRDITRTPPEKRPFNIVFQRYALFPHLNLRDNVAFGLTTSRAIRPPADELRQRVDQALAMVGLSALGARMPSQISGGQAQRVALARALIRRPQMLLLDEPLSALDRNVRHAVREELLRIHAELGTTFLLVTHDQEEALSMSERVALMNAGHIEQVAAPEAIYRNPETLFAARFIGAGSFVPGAAGAASSGRIEVAVGGRSVLAADAGVGSSRRVQVLFRPEELEVSGPEEGDGLQGTVEVCAFFGSHYEATIACGGIVLRARSTVALAPGAPVRVKWAPQAGIAYPDRETLGGDDVSV